MSQDMAELIQRQIEILSSRIESIEESGGKDRELGSLENELRKYLDMKLKNKELQIEKEQTYDESRETLRSLLKEAEIDDEKAEKLYDALKRDMEMNEDESG